MSNHQSTIAVFVDFENLALGYKGQGRFEIQIVFKRLLEKGKIVAKKAYCDWSRFREYTSSLHEAACELIEIPKRGQTGKNSADIRLCVDAMDLAYSKDHIDTFVIVSGDSDFSPLVSKLKELGKHVIGFGMTASTSGLLRDNCDEFIYYETLVSQPTQLVGQVSGQNGEPKQRAFELLFESLQALRRENREVLASPLVKQTLLRMHPSFAEAQYGFRNWGSLLVDAQKEGLIELTNDPRNGNFVVTKFGDELKTGAVTNATEHRSEIGATQPQTPRNNSARRNNFHGRRPSVNTPKETLESGTQESLPATAPSVATPMATVNPEPAQVSSTKNDVETTAPQRGATRRRPSAVTKAPAPKKPAATRKKQS